MNIKKRAFSLIELSIVILVVGILVAGVIQASNLVSKFRLSNAQTLTQSSPVSSIKNLVLWLDTTSKSSFSDLETEDGSKVTFWYDLNPSRTIKNNAKSIISPTYIKDCINSLPCLKFDRNGNYLETTFDIGRTLDFTIFTVFSVTGTQKEDYGSLIATKEYDAGDGSLWYYSYTSGENSIYYEDNESLGFEIEYLKNYVTSFVNTNAKYVHYSNGNLSASKNIIPISSNSISTQPNFLQIGAWNDISNTNPESYSEAFNGNIGEIIIFNRALKEEERKAIEKYLGQKWGIKVS
jgi:prepilin-type N-terminal cleavage/methylation domain-containing protein